mmetsp:Transcript_32021/g.57339  ORF Transcript_32021/g.57339 Transcript_32021/m.57339 type:complete len:294 (+) Transcript_32021:253-1134(+)
MSSLWRRVSRACAVDYARPVPNRFATMLMKTSTARLNMTLKMLSSPAASSAAGSPYFPESLAARPLKKSPTPFQTFPSRSPTNLSPSPSCSMGLLMPASSYSCSSSIRTLDGEGTVKSGRSSGPDFMEEIMLFMARWLSAILRNSGSFTSSITLLMMPSVRCMMLSASNPSESPPEEGLSMCERTGAVALRTSSWLMSPYESTMLHTSLQPDPSKEPLPLSPASTVSESVDDSRGGRIWCEGRGASARAGAELGEAVAAAAAVAKVVAIGLATRAASCWNMASYPLLEDGPLK